MTTAVTRVDEQGQQEQALAPLPSSPAFNLPAEVVDRLHRTIWTGFTNDQIADCVHICCHLRLDPILRQIYFIPRKGKITPQTSIDGYRAIAERTHRYAGSDDATYAYNEDGSILSATVTVYKLLGGQRCPFTATAFMEEYFPPAGQDQMWKQRPHGQIAKCAESLALRKAFPHELGGVYTDEEMAQADAPEPSPAPTKSADAPKVATRAERAAAPNADPLHAAKSEVIDRWMKLNPGKSKADCAEWVAVKLGRDVRAQPATAADLENISIILTEMGG